MKITYHCSRHSYAVLLLENKTDIFTVAKMLGHKDMKSTLIYLKFTDELKHKAMNALPSFDF
jgi:site-specific recombinase XerD